MTYEKGKCYKRCDLPSGKSDWLFLHEDGSLATRVIGAGIDPKQNPDAPFVVLVRPGSTREQSAERFCQQPKHPPIKVFLKRAPDRWEFRGDFVAVECNRDPAEIKRHAERSKRPESDIAMIVYLKEVE